MTLRVRLQWPGGCWYHSWGSWGSQPEGEEGYGREERESLGGKVMSSNVALVFELVICKM